MMRTALAALILLGVQTDAPGFVLALDGGALHQPRLVLKASATSYCNFYLSSSSDPRVNRLDLCGTLGNDWRLNFGVPASIGTFVYAENDDERVDRNPYLRFTFLHEPPGGGMPRVLAPIRVEIAITRLDPPGGRIEGTLKGTIHDGATDAVVTLSGSFSLLRFKDRVVG